LEAVMDFDLSQRQQLILLAVVLDYIDSAEPVGSRTISKRYDMGLSPATIRNEMAELEEKGLLVQPHASAGRVPSDFGYRTFVDYLMEKPALSDNELDSIKNIRFGSSIRLENILEQSARILSALSDSLAIIQFPDAHTEKVKHFQLLPLNQFSFVIVVVSNTGKVTDYIVKMEQPVDESFFGRMNNYFNEVFVGTPVNTLKKKLSDLISGNLNHDVILKNIYNAISDSFSTEKNKFVVSGTSKLIKEPEFTENKKLQNLINFFESDDGSHELSEIFMSSIEEFNQNSPIILIGKEIRINDLQDCSIVMGKYNIGNSLSGTIGLLGPTRMRYGKSVAALEEMIKNLSYLLTKMYAFKSEDTG